MKNLIIKNVSQKLGIHADDIRYVYDAIFKEMSILLAQKTNISIKGFGRFVVKNKPSYKKVFMGKLIDTKEKNYIKFSPSIFIKESINIK